MQCLRLTGLSGNATTLHKAFTTVNTEHNCIDWGGFVLLQAVK